MEHVFKILLSNSILPFLVLDSQSSQSFVLQKQNIIKIIASPWGNIRITVICQINIALTRLLGGLLAAVPSITSASHAFTSANLAASDLLFDSIDRASANEAIMSLIVTLSAQSSFSRLKDQLLPKNPNIYHFSEIHATTDGLSARRFSYVRIQSLIEALVLLCADSNRADLEREEEDEQCRPGAFFENEKNRITIQF
ncbi:hypothetical protein CRG98_018581 [Punica granatum]|uniref:Uncharacterized protein n=1 Tax=Punica granatum TaxID=22663 RepID=A0A2I0JXH3_PUNGR|nr:hypothetical protein CRG98_018581 [Punica granatum]